MVVPTRRAFWILISIVVLLVVMHFSGLHHFDLDTEANFPTWYSTQLLFSVALVSLGISLLDGAPKSSKAFWLVMSGVYCFLSIDEASVLHEALQRPALPWMIFYAPLAGAFFIYCAYHLIRGDNKQLRNWVLGGLMVYALGGLVGQTIIHYLQLPQLFQALEPAIEESVEMTGSIMVLTGCLGEFSRLFNTRFVAARD
jgi:hypothetical protein